MTRAAIVDRWECGMREQGRQAVGVVLTLVGDQDTAVAVHDPTTDGAAVSVRIGRALIYMHSRDTVEAMVRAWHGLSGDAVRLPRSRGTRRLVEVRGMSEPSIVVNVDGVPPVLGKLVQGRGEYGRLSLTVGRVMFDVRDIPAFASTIVAFREAELLARTAFPGAVALPLRRRAVQDAAKAFGTPRGATPSVGASRGSIAGRASVGREISRPSLSQEWMQ